MSFARIRNRFRVRLAVMSVLFLNPAVTSADEVTYSRDVRPILAAKCFNCHGFDAGSRQGDLRLDRREFAEHVLSNEDGSMLLLDRVTSDDPEMRMPPPK